MPRTLLLIAPRHLPAMPAYAGTRHKGRPDGATAVAGAAPALWATELEAVAVMSLSRSPTGHLTNLSTAPDRAGW